MALELANGRRGQAAETNGAARVPAVEILTKRLMAELAQVRVRAWEMRLDTRGHRATVVQLRGVWGSRLRASLLRIIKRSSEMAPTGGRGTLCGPLMLGSSRGPSLLRDGSFS